MLQKRHGPYLSRSEEEATDALDRFATRTTPLSEFHKVVDTLLRWAPEIFAFHRSGRWTNRRLEGPTPSWRLKRMAFGSSTPYFEARGMLLCPARSALA